MEKDVLPNRLNDNQTYFEFSTRGYSQLKRLVKEKDLLEKQPIYYTYKISFTLSLLVIGLALLPLLNSLWLQFLDAIYLSFVFTQVGLIGHDAGHRQIFQTAWKNDIIGLMDNLLLGLSFSWWVNKHNRHHSHPNQVDLDPDIDIPFISFTEEQVQSQHKVGRFITKYQAYFFFALFTLLPLTMRIRSFQFLLGKKSKSALFESFLIIMNFLLYFGFLLFRLGIWEALLFFSIQQMLFGVFMGSIFASNHKGMLILDKQSQMDFLHRQVLTSRNIKTGLLTDFWFGGLNYQIEHHLFPNMARNKLKKAQQIVKVFCQIHSISYHESSMLQSYKEIHIYLHSIGTSLSDRKPELGDKLNKTRQ